MAFKNSLPTPSFFLKRFHHSIQRQPLLISKFTCFPAAGSYALKVHLQIHLDFSFSRIVHPSRKEIIQHSYFTLFKMHFKNWKKPAILLLQVRQLDILLDFLLPLNHLWTFLLMLYILWHPARSSLWKTLKNFEN